jgi:hypothetical protein
VESALAIDAIDEHGAKVLISTSPTGLIVDLCIADMPRELLGHSL